MTPTLGKTFNCAQHYCGQLMTSQHMGTCLDGPPKGSVHAPVAMETHIRFLYGLEVHVEMAIFDKCGQARGGYESITLSDEEYKQACMYVLQNCEHVWPFME